MASLIQIRSAYNALIFSSTLTRQRGFSSAIKCSHKTTFSFISNLKADQSTGLLKSVTVNALSCQSPEERRQIEKLHEDQAANLNTSPKKEGTSTLHRPEWTNATISKAKRKGAAAGADISQSSAISKPVWKAYLALSKPNLSFLVVLSAMSAYALTSNAATVPQLLFLSAGTALCSASANSINMGREYKWDALMTRTSVRPVVRGLVSPNQAYSFATAAGTLGTAILYYGLNPTVAFLGASNIALYAGLYTTLKRKSITNTWVGAIVGAIPPLMGWAASASLSDPGAWLLAGLLYAWQFPHFNALSHNIGREYKNAGYIMTCWKNPALNARVALRYSLLMFPLCIGLAYYGVTDWYYALDSSILNGWLSYLAFQFWRVQRNATPENFDTRPVANGIARKLFWGSVWHLPGVLLLAMIHKKGQWDWVGEYFK